MKIDVQLDNQQPTQVQPSTNIDIPINSPPHKVKSYLRLMRLDKPIGIFLLLWPTLLAVWIAGSGHPEPRMVLIFGLGVVVMRSAGCVINDLADRDFDGAVTRTKMRPLPAKHLTAKEALACLTLLLIIALGLALQLNFKTFLLSWVALGLASLYPFLKRITHLPQVILGAAFGWGIPMAFCAITDQVPKIAWLLFSANLLWTLVYDTEYAMADRDDDIKIGLKSTAILFGKQDRLIIGIFQILVLGLFIQLGLLQQYGIPYFFGVLTAALLFGYQQWLIYHRHPEKCFNAFLNNHYVGAAVFLGLVMDTLYSQYWT